MQPSAEHIVPDRQSSFKLRTVTAPEGFGFAWHQHRDCELTLVLDAHGTRYVGDRVEPVSAADLVLLGPNVPHTWDCPPADTGATPRAIVVQFDAERLLASPCPPEYQRVTRLLNDAERGLAADATLTSELQPRLIQLGELEPFARRAGLLDILHTLATQPEALRPLSHRAWAPDLTRPDQQRMDRVCGYLNEHFRASVRLSDVATIAGMSEAALCRAFKQATGRTVMHQVNALRVTHALTQLRDTDHTIAQIAYEAGFGNLSNFNRRFKALEGQTPSAYRQGWKRREGQ